ncbi:hypothetical protein ACFODL_05060 [Phenylobacterium terrae]|uniref:hypothetical protein n=1 Tax=Phenylobacterium terrae TaxID=2665495 RepID=UPI003618C370
MALTDHLVLPLPERPGARPAPVGMNLLVHEFLNGLPGRLPLGGDLALVLSAPTGAMKVWLDLPPSTIVYDAGREAVSTPPDAPAARPEPVPFRLYLISGPALVGAAPLRLGRRTLLPEAGTPLLELVLLDAVITAGAVRGLPLSGSRLRLAWRRAGTAAGDPPRSSPPPPARRGPAVARRLSLEDARFRALGEPPP